MLNFQDFNLLICNLHFYKQKLCNQKIGFYSKRKIFFQTSKKVLFLKLFNNYLNRFDIKIFIYIEILCKYIITKILSFLIKILLI